MGTTKQLLRLGEQTVLGATLDALRGADLAETVVVLGASAEAIGREIDFAAMGGVRGGVRVVVNADYGSGMASSLRRGLAALGPGVDGALIVLGDQPLIRAETVDRIIERYRLPVAGYRLQVTGSKLPGVEIVIPVCGGRRGNPVLLDRSVFGEAMALEGDVGCRAIFGLHAEGIVTVEVDDGGILEDIDSKEDYERVRLICE
jgi:molybdenum cofactor cytidylyltransferase